MWLEEEWQDLGASPQDCGPHTCPTRDVEVFKAVMTVTLLLFTPS